MGSSLACYSLQKGGSDTHRIIIMCSRGQRSSDMLITSYSMYSFTLSVRADLQSTYIHCIRISAHMMRLHFIEQSKSTLCLIVKIM